MKPNNTIAVDEHTQVPEEIWTCKDGRQIPVAALSEDHAKNILRMILRNRRIRRLRRERMEKRREQAEAEAMDAIHADRIWGSD